MHFPRALENATRQTSNCSGPWALTDKSTSRHRTKRNLPFCPSVLPTNYSTTPANWWHLIYTRRRHHDKEPADGSYCIALVTLLLGWPFNHARSCRSPVASSYMSKSHLTGREFYASDCRCLSWLSKSNTIYDSPSFRATRSSQQRPIRHDQQRAHLKNDRPAYDFLPAEH